MKTKQFRKRSGSRQPLKCAPKHAKGFKASIIGVIRPSPMEFPDGIDEEEALVVAESLDEREKRG